jgi:hypothetical protein
MNLEWLKDNLIYLTVAGSRSYGMANDLSDLDIKGIAIPPREIEYNLYHRFEQAENNAEINAIVSHMANPKNPKIESTVYSLRKFFLLAAEVNPNIIELLFTDESDHVVMTPIMGTLIENRELFLSSRSRFTFAGYAASQLKKIERHNKWIVKGEIIPPNREDFGLPSIRPKEMEEIHGYIKSKVEQWNLNQFPIDEMLRAELKDTIWDLLTNVTDKEVSVANWPDVYAEGVIHKMKTEFNLKDEVANYIHAERSYAKSKQVYDSWIAWKKERNPARRALEIKSGYDTKHAAMLVRLLRLGYEILTTGKVIVKRPDADELLDIKNGAWSFDQVMEFKEEMERKLETEYIYQKQLIAEGKPTPLRREVDKVKLNNLYHELFEKYWDGQDVA